MVIGIPFIVLPERMMSFESLSQPAKLTVSSSCSGATGTECWVIRLKDKGNNLLTHLLLWIKFLYAVFILLKIA